MDFNLFSIKKRGILFKSYNIFKDDHLKYTVKASAFVRKYVIYDQHGLELLQIKRPFSLSPFSMTFTINKFDQPIAEVTKDSKLFANNLTIIAKDGVYNAEGNFKANDFTIFKNENEEVAKISRHHAFAKKQYGVAILDSEDDLLILSIVMIIEMMIRVKRARKSG